MIYCPTVKDYKRLMALLSPIPEGLLELLFSRGLSIRVLRGTQDDFKSLYSKLGRMLTVYPPDTRYPHESAHFHIGAKQIIMYRKDLYHSYNVPLHELGHAVDFLAHSTVSPLSEHPFIIDKLSKTPHLNSYTETMDEARLGLMEHYATCFSAYFCEPVGEKLYGYHSIDELHEETVKYFKDSIITPLENRYP